MKTSTLQMNLNPDLEHLYYWSPRFLWNRGCQSCWAVPNGFYFSESHSIWNEAVKYILTQKPGIPKFFLVLPQRSENDLFSCTCLMYVNSILFRHLLHVFYMLSASLWSSEHMEGELRIQEDSPMFMSLHGVWTVSHRALSYGTGGLWAHSAPQANTSHRSGHPGREAYLETY